MSSVQFGLLLLLFGVLTIPVVILVSVVAARRHRAPNSLWIATGVALVVVVGGLSIAFTPTQIGEIYCGAGDPAVFDVLDSGTSMSTTDTDYPGLDVPCRERARAQVGWSIVAGTVALAVWGAAVYRVRRLPRTV
jgi:hypothetical protein